MVWLGPMVVDYFADNRFHYNMADNTIETEYKQKLCMSQKVQCCPIAIGYHSTISAIKGVLLYNHVMCMCQ